MAPGNVADSTTTSRPEGLDPAAATASQPRVCVVIVNYHAEHFLAEWAEGLASQTFRDFEVIIVDNASAAGGFAGLALPDRWRVLTPAANLGFAAGNNLAVAATAAPWIATFNPDVWPRSDWLEQLVAATQRYPDAVMFGSTQLMMDRPERADGLGDSLHISGITWRGAHQRRIPDSYGEGEVFAPCAAAALYRRSAFIEVGGFDENFFCYCEDVDLAFRLRLAGGRAIQVAAAVVQHAGSVTTGRRSEFSTFYGARNSCWLFVKNMPGLLFWMLLPVMLCGRLALLLQACWRGEGLTHLRGLAAAVKGLPRIWAARRETQKHRRATIGTVARVLTWSPVAALRRSPGLRRIESTPPWTDMTEARANLRALSKFTVQDE